MNTTTAEPPGCLQEAAVSVPQIIVLSNSGNPGAGFSVEINGESIHIDKNGIGNLKKLVGKLIEKILVNGRRVKTPSGFRVQNDTKLKSPIFDVLRASFIRRKYSKYLNIEKTTPSLIFDDI